jgi:hypothetical protein
MKLVKFGNILVNPQYVISIHQTVQGDRCCLCLVSDGDGSGGIIHVNGTLEQVAERLGAAIV